jgi:hypothetical protein
MTWEQKRIPLSQETPVLKVRLLNGVVLTQEEPNSLKDRGWLVEMEQVVCSAPAAAEESWQS